MASHKARPVDGSMSRRPTSPSAGQPVRITDLSFVAMRDGETLPLPIGNQTPRCFWKVTPTGSLRGDNALGGRLAVEYLDFAAAFRAQGDALEAVLGWIVADMPRPLTPIEVGFFTVMSRALVGGVDCARREVKAMDRIVARPEAA